MIRRAKQPSREMMRKASPAAAYSGRVSTRVSIKCCQSPPARTDRVPLRPNASREGTVNSHYYSTHATALRAELGRAISRDQMRELHKLNICNLHKCL